VSESPHPRSLRIATLNAGLLRLQLGRWTVFEPVPDVEPRVAGLVRFLSDLDVDVLALQEVFVRGCRRRLVEALAGVFPHAAFSDSRSWLGNGLLTLSRHQIRAAAFHRFRSDFLMIRPFASFGLLRTAIEWPGGAALTVFNTHLTAGPYGDPERARVERVRGRQIDQLLAAARTVEPPGAPVAIAGDFNAGPGVSEANYRSVLGAGFDDAFDRAERRDGPLETTWTPDNPLSQSGPHSDSPPQRIDHVFLRGRPRPSVPVVRIVEAATDGGEPLTDHRLMVAEVRFDGERGRSDGASAVTSRY
jgi:endonuclease/exonuclease/phosphatase family metal-dependent hydrolase